MTFADIVVVAVAVVTYFLLFLLLLLTLLKNVVVIITGFVVVSGVPLVAYITNVLVEIKWLVIDLIYFNTHHGDRYHSSKETLAILYWSYNSCTWAMGISCIVLVLVIVCRMAMDAENYETKGPSKTTKVIYRKYKSWFCLQIAYL